jgi:DNA recombination protein RmuC
MTILYILLGVIIILTSLALFFAYKGSNSNTVVGLADMKYKLDDLPKEIGRIETSVKNEISTNRAENNEAAKNVREELSNYLKTFGQLITASIKETSGLQKTQLETFSTNLNLLTKSVEEKLTALTTSIDTKFKEFGDTSTANSKDSRKELKDALTSFQTDFSKSVESFNTAQKDNFFALLSKQTEQNTATSTKLDQMRETLEKKIGEMQVGNEKKLDEMRTTVDEKLQKTLEARLGESFKQVSERLEAVHKGLGDMQQLATGVGDLKKVLTNVKSRGILGEYQLENILEQLLTPDQYEKNVKTKVGSNSMVEFAVKLPGKGEEDKVVWLPIDSKFPKEDFEVLVEAYENANVELIEEYRKSFVKGIKKCAADISGKYVDPPNTTDFAILFLPFESLYAEVLRTPGLFESLQREYKIIITGPTTLSALLSSLQMGFRTLAIEKRSSEVWGLLSAVKTEFKDFGGILQRTQKKLQEASNVMDQASVRTRAIERKLRDVHELPIGTSTNLIEKVIETNILDDEEETATN